MLLEMLETVHTLDLAICFEGPVTWTTEYVVTDNLPSGEHALWWSKQTEQHYILCRLRQNGLVKNSFKLHTDFGGKETFNFNLWMLRVGSILYLQLTHMLP